MVMASPDSLAEPHSPQERAQIVESDRPIRGSGEYLKQELVLSTHRAMMGPPTRITLTIRLPLVPNALEIFRPPQR